MRENVTSGEVPFRKAYIQSVVGSIQVKDGLVRIIGDECTLEQDVVARAMTPDGVRRSPAKRRAIFVQNCERRPSPWRGRRRLFQRSLIPDDANNPIVEKPIEELVA